MNIKPNVHNAVMIIALALLGFLALKWASRTQLANVPVVGQVIKLSATA